MTAELLDLKQYLDTKRVDCVLTSIIEYGELTVDVAPAQLFSFVDWCSNIVFVGQPPTNVYQLANPLPIPPTGTYWNFYS